MAETGGLPAVAARVLGFICLTEAILVGLLTLGVVGLFVGLLLVAFTFGSPPLLTWFLLEVAVFLVGLVACFALHRAGKWLTAKATSAGGPSAIAVPDTLGEIGLAVEFVVAVWRFWQFLNRASWLQGPRVTKALPVHCQRRVLRRRGRRVLDPGWPAVHGDGGDQRGFGGAGRYHGNLCDPGAAWLRAGPSPRSQVSPPSPTFTTDDGMRSPKATEAAPAARCTVRATRSGQRKGTARSRAGRRLRAP